MRLALAALVGFLSIQDTMATRRAVWIDTDPSLGAPWREVDDAYALMLALRSPELRVVGISTTYGNASVRRTTVVARELMTRFGSATPVFAGAASPLEANKTTAATEALAVALRKERLTYIALGPCTNLAGFIRKHPVLAQRIDRVILLGGKAPEDRLRFGSNEWLRVHDANVFKDRAAVEEVLRAGLPLTLAPIATAARVRFDHRDLGRVARNRRAGRYLAERSRVWLWFWTRFVGEKGGPLFDVLAVLAAAESKDVRMETRFAYLDRDGDLIAARGRSKKARAVRYCAGLKAGAKEAALRRLEGL